MSRNWTCALAPAAVGLLAVLSEVTPSAASCQTKECKVLFTEDLNIPWYGEGLDVGSISSDCYTWSADNAWSLKIYSLFAAGGTNTPTGNSITEYKDPKSTTCPNKDCANVDPVAINVTIPISQRHNNGPTTQYNCPSNGTQP